MKTVIGEEATKLTYQEEFPKTTPCVYCNSTREAEIVFATAEDSNPFVCDLKENDPKGEGYWPHDSCAFAVYFCRKCFKTTALWNQA